MNTITIGILRREESDLSAEERQLLADAFRGQIIQFVPLHSRDYLEHAELCRRLDIVCVVLPKEKPIPSKAMDDGIPHITVRDGRLVQLKPLVPEFHPFKIN